MTRRSTAVRTTLGAVVTAVLVTGALATPAVAQATPAPTAAATAGHGHGTGHGHDSVAADRARWAGRAADSYRAMQRNLFVADAGAHGLYREDTGSSDPNPYSYLWEYREATQAAVDLQRSAAGGPAYRAAAGDRVAGLEQYSAAPDGRAGYESYLPAPLGGGGDVYYDDNTVVGLSFVSQYQATHDSRYLQRAEAAFAVVTRGWNTDASLTCPGGMDWIDRPDNTVRGANITGLAAQLSAHLYELTGRVDYLGWSTKLYDWNVRCLQQSPGLYENSLSDDGSRDATLWTYNSGAMIGTATVLYRATGDRTWLGRAVRDADGATAYWTQARLQQQPAIFDAFLFRDLLLLDSVRHTSTHRALVADYAEARWQHNRDATTGLFHFQPSGGGDPDWSRPAATLDQAAMTQVLVLLAWDPARQGDVA